MYLPKRWTTATESLGTVYQERGRQQPPRLSFLQPVPPQTRPPISEQSAQPVAAVTKKIVTLGRIAFLFALPWSTVFRAAVLAGHIVSSLARADRHPAQTVAVAGASARLILPVSAFLRSPRPVSLKYPLAI